MILRHTVATFLAPSYRGNKLQFTIMHLLRASSRSRVASRKSKIVVSKHQCINAITDAQTRFNETIFISPSYYSTFPSTKKGEKKQTTQKNPLVFARTKLPSILMHGRHLAGGVSEFSSFFPPGGQHVRREAQFAIRCETEARSKPYYSSPRRNFVSPHHFPASPRSRGSGRGRGARGGRYLLLKT